MPARYGLFKLIVTAFNSFQHYMPGKPGHHTRPHALLPPSSLGMDAWTTIQMKVALIHKLRWPLLCLAYFDMLSMCACTTRHWQTSGRLVQESNVCTVAIKCSFYDEIFVNDLSCARRLCWYYRNFGIGDV